MKVSIAGASGFVGTQLVARRSKCFGDSMVSGPVSERSSR